MKGPGGGIAGPINARPNRNPGNVPVTMAQAAIAAPTDADGEARPERAAAAEAIHPVPEHKRSAGDTEVEDGSWNARPLGTAAQIGPNDRRNRGRCQKPGRAQRLRDKQRPGDLSRDVHDGEYIRDCAWASMSQRKDVEAQSGWYFASKKFATAP